jgi:hypothetical protein
MIHTAVEWRYRRYFFACPKSQLLCSYYHHIDDETPKLRNQQDCLATEGKIASLGVPRKWSESMERSPRFSMLSWNPMKASEWWNRIFNVRWDFQSWLLDVLHYCHLWRMIFKVILSLWNSVLSSKFNAGERHNRRFENRSSDSFERSAIKVCKSTMEWELILIGLCSSAGTKSWHKISQTTINLRRFNVLCSVYCLNPHSFAPAIQLIFRSYVIL